MKTRDILEPVAPGQKLAIGDVHWDGKFVWIGTQDRGLWVVTTDGSIATRIDSAQGLPPADQGILLHPIDAGRMLAIGNQGRNRRTWLAIVEWNGSAGKVNVVHTATRVPLPSDDWQELQEDMNVIFAPGWVMEDKDPDQPGHRVLRVGRNRKRPEGRSLPALQIDLATLAVSLRKDTHAPGFPEVRIIDGKPWFLGNITVTRYGTEDGLFGRRVRLRKRLGRGPALGRVVPYNGCIYMPGSTWIRIDCRTCQQTEFKVDPPDTRRLGEGFNLGVSAHYGLMAVDERDPQQLFFHVQIIEPEDTGSEPMGGT